MSIDRKFDLVASGIMFVLGLSGISVNVYFFISTIARKKFDSSFFKFCRTRAVANVVMASIFILWAVPCTFLGYVFLTETFNGVVGQIAGWGAYIIGPFIQFCIAVNRLFASYFPAKFRTWHDKKLTYAVIALSIMIGAGYFSLGLPEGCAFHYNLTLLSWLPEENTCAWDRAYYIFYSIAVLFAASSILNIASFAVLMKYMVKNHSVNQAERSRERKNWSLLIQNIVQDSFFLIDLIAVTFAVKWYSGIWYQFLLNSALWLIHINADGLVMIYSNKKFLKFSPRNTITSDRVLRTARDTLQSTRITH